MAWLLLAIAFAIVSGFNYEQGIYAAIVASGLTSLFDCFAISGAIFRTANEIRSGASGKLVGIVHNIQGVRLL